MKTELDRFFDSISYKDEENNFKETIVDKVVVHKKEKTFEVFLKAKNPINPEALFALYKKCKKGINKTSPVKVKIVYENYNDEAVIECFSYLLNELVKRRPSLSGIVENKVLIEDKKIIIEVNSKIEEKLISEEKANLLNILDSFGYEENDIMSNKVDNPTLLERKEDVVIVQSPKKEEPETNVIYGQNIRNDKEITTLNNIMGEVGNLVCEIFVFGAEYIVREKIHLINIKISDLTDSLNAKIKFFQKDFNNSKGVSKKVKEGSWYRVEGKVEYDQYMKDLVLDIKNMEAIDSKFSKRSDNATSKRIELHAHTCMSQMDAVVSAKALVKQAKAFGHKAVAITDHNCLQAYPEAYGEREGIKVIYGVELNVIDDEVNIIYNRKNYHLLNDCYVVFDTETTGFNATGGDQMIEIGAVKITNGEITDRFDELIDPKRELPKKITELTAITDSMLKGKRSEEEVLKDFMKWVGNLPMVAHNAKFDISFVESGFRKFNLGDFNNTVIDTLELSRILSPDQSKHNLSILTKRYDITFDEQGHHRADYDAEATAKVFYKMGRIFDSKNIETLDDLIENVDINELLKFNRPYHMTIYAKDHNGLKNLFKIVSMANTTYLFKTPRIPRSEIVKNKEGLIIGSACVNGEIFNAAKSKSEEELRELMRLYDFIEVNPPSICEYLVSTGEFSNKEELFNNIRKIIEMAKITNKMVCATGDVHQLNKEDTIYREIIVNQKTPNVGMHPLYKPGVITVPAMYFMTTNEMKEEFSFLNDDDLVEEIVVNNPNTIADMFEEQEIIKDKLYTPKMENSDEITREMVWNKAHEMYGEVLPPLIEDRLEKELNGIINNGYSVLYLIAQKLVKKSNDAGYFVGSRGSVGSSFVATMMDITEVNALPAHYLCPKCKKSIFEVDGKMLAMDYKSGYDLPDRLCGECHIKMQKEGQDMPFATFLGFEAEKVPDIDLNFSGENQADAHNYTKELFGEHNVFRAGTIGTVAFKTAYGYIKGYMEAKGMSLRNIEVERLANGLLGVKRTTGQHPGGIIVIPDYMDVFDFTPYQYPADDPNNTWYTTHFDFHAIHDNILKLDILGHDDPTMLKYLKDTTGVDFMTIPFDDKKVLSLFTSPKALGVTKEQINCSTGTLGIPEFGTNFVIKMLEETKPKTFAELVKISGLSHGTDVWNGNARDLIVNNVIPFKEVIGCRDDIMVSLIDYGMAPSQSFKISEFVRKGKASKDPDKWAEMVSQMKEAKIPDWFIGSCGKIKYMFPKAHATAYVMMGFRVAWYKVYYPIYYYANFFGIRCSDFDVEDMIKGEAAVKKKIFELKEKGFAIANKEKDLLDVLNIVLEMFARGFSFKNIDIEKSHGTRFIVSEDEKSIYLPFRALDGLGDTVANKIIEESNIKEFSSIEDFQERCKISNTTIEKLRSLGVLDGLPESNQLSLF